MAHLIDNSRGTAAFVSYRKPAWHGLGLTAQEKMTFDEAFKLGQLDYNVVKAPNKHEVPGHGTIISSNSFFTYREDTGGILGDKLGKAYFPVQNHEALSVVEELISEGGIIETAGALSGGARAFICVKLPEGIKVNGTDVVEQFAVIACGHDGSLGIQAYFTNVRVVCNNTLQVSLQAAKQKHSIRHTPNAKDKLKEAAKLMGIAGKNQTEMERAYNMMAQESAEETRFFDYLGNVFFSNEEIKEITNGGRAKEVISTRKMNVVQDVIRYYNRGVGQQDIKGTMWGAYNAVTGYFSNVKTFETAEARMDSLLFESAAGTMQKAAQLAINTSEIISLRKTTISSFNQN